MATADDRTSSAACPNCGHALAKTNRGWWWCSRCERRMRLKDSVARDDLAGTMPDAGHEAGEPATDASAAQGRPSFDECGFRPADAPCECGFEDEHPAATVEERDLFDALDLPLALTPLQDAYWKARREWQERDAAYRLVLKEMLAYEEADPHV